MERENINSDNIQIIDYLKDLDTRVSRIEAKLNLASAPAETSAIKKADNSDENKLADMKVGEYWFANLGILVLVIIFSFLMTKPFVELNQFIPSVVGLFFVGVLFLVSNLTRKTLSNISTYLFGSAFFMLFLSMLRLFHFTPEAALNNPYLEFILLLLVSFSVMYVSIKRELVFLNVLGILFLGASGLTSNNSYLIFTILTLVSLTVVYLYKTKEFITLSFLVFGMLFTYLTHFIWAINNPFFGNSLEIVTEPAINFIFLLIYMTIYAFGLIINKNEENTFEELSSYINSIICYLLFSLILWFGYKEDMVLYQTGFFIVSIGIAIIFWKNLRSKNSTYIYSLISFVALGIAVMMSIEVPNVFLPLIWQSLVVIALAIWFESKSILISNFLIYLVIFIAYLIYAQSLSIASISFGIVALISARILNWQKNRLTLKTEFMRNTYLGVAFFALPFSLIKSIPVEFIGLSLIGLAIVYYVLSTLLNNFKYRWMAHLTLLGSLVYILGFGLSIEDTLIQVITLLTLALTLIFVSIYYTRMRVKSDVV